MTGDAIRTALYRFFDIDGRLLYVGISDQPGRRWEAHMRLKPWWSDVHRQTLQWYPNRAAAAKAEVSEIIKEKPLHNRRHSIRMPHTVFLASPWTCTACGWGTQDPVEQISHMESEAKRLTRRLPREDADRLLREIARMKRSLAKLDISLERTQDLFDRAALMPGARRGPARKKPAPAASREMTKLLEDLDAILGEERVRLAELPTLLRQLDPSWPPYRKLTGVRIRELLDACGVRVTNTGNVRRLDPADLRRVHHAAA